jgi:hypothetical protein
MHKDQLHPEFTLRRQDDSVNDLCYVEQDLLAASYSSGVLILWSLITRRPIATWQAHQDIILGLSVINHVLIRFIKTLFLKMM